MLDPTDIERTHDEWINLLDKHEDEIRPRAQKIIMRAYQRAAAGVKESTIENELEGALHRLYVAHYARVIRTFASWGLKQRPIGQKSYRNLERKGIVDDIVKTASGWITATGFEMSKLAAQTTMAAIRKILVAGITQSEREEAVAVRNELARQGLKVSRGRAKTIARMETVRAADQGVDAALKKHKDDGVIINAEQWITAGDERVRITHRNVTAKPGDEIETGNAEGEDFLTVEKISEDADHVQSWPKIREGGKFIVGGSECSRPRDPVLPAHEIFGCRCLKTFITDPGRFFRNR